jgi:hypothetical protein
VISPAQTCLGCATVNRRKVDATPGGHSELTSPPSISSDLDGDGDIDKNDIGIILAAKGTAAVGPNDPRDIDKDGWITILLGCEKADHNVYKAELRDPIAHN